MSKYIDADKLLKLLNACKYPVNKTTRREITYNASISDARRCVDAMPAADVVEVRHGRWRHYEGMLTCSVCGTDYYDDIMEYLGDDVPRYCPNCGSRMDLECEDD